MLIAVRDSLLSSFIPSPHNLEIVCIRIGTDLCYQLYLCTSRVSSFLCFFLTSLVHFLTYLTSSFSKCIIVGDFNINGHYTFIYVFL